LVCGPQFEETGLENLEQLLYLYVFSDFGFLLWHLIINYMPF